MVAAVSEPEATAQRACAKAGITVAPLTTMPEMRSAAALFDRVWGLGPGEQSEMQPALLRALEHAGGYVVGAYAGKELVAASVAFLAAPIGRGLHSHITGVTQGRAGTGVGAALKWHQRAWCLRRGIDVVTWTYDPLIARNSFFNIARLGARPGEYLVDFYGVMADELNAGQPTDRVLAVWNLTAEPVKARGEANFSPRSAADWLAAGAQVRLDQLGRADDTEADTLLIAVPADVETLRRNDPDQALRWRLVLREVLAPLIGPDTGWGVVDFLRDGWYVLTRNNSTSSGVAL